MKKFTFSFKSLLVACGLLIGSANAWGDGTKHVIYSNDFESVATPAEAGWSGHANANVAISTNDSYSSYGKFISGWPYGSGNRSMGGNLSFTSNGYTSSSMTSLGYVIEFDALLKGGSQNGKAQAQMIIGTSTIKTDGNAYSQPADYLFAISQPTNTTGTNETTWYINDLNNTTGAKTIDNTIFYHWKFVVTKTSVEYTISAAGKEDITGSKTLSLDEVPIAKQVYVLLGRTSAWFLFDNIEIYDYVDTEVVSAPTINAPTYLGDNRSVTISGGLSSKSNSVTTYYTTDGSTPTSSSTVYTEPITITENCTVKAISISSESVESAIDSRSVTVGKLTLNAPTVKKTAYSAGNFTVTITNDQSSLDYVPASSTVYYTIDGGSKTEYTAPVNVPQGSTISAHVESANYTSSSAAEIETGFILNWPSVWSQDYRNLVDADVTIEQATEGGPFSHAILSNAGGDYYVYSSDGTSATTNANAGFQTYWHSKSNRKWLVREAGLYSFGAGNTSFAIANLKEGQIVKVYGDTEFTAGAGFSRIDNISYGNTWYFAATADGTGKINLGRSKYVYTIDVYSTTVPVTITDARYATFSSTYALDLTTANTPSGLTAYYIDKDDLTAGNAPFTTINQTVAAGEGILLKGAAGTYDIKVAATGTALTNNALVATDGTAIAAGNYVFAYVTANPSTTAGFYYVSTATAPVAAGKAYLDGSKVPDATVKAFIFDGTATGIEAPAIAEETEEDGILYNTAGQVVSKDYKGIVIMNGKKFINK